MDFKNCLYGSEPERSARKANHFFLSCLYGSERMRFCRGADPWFLSCLYGSELTFKLEIDSSLFLSCLYGSEHQRQATNGRGNLSKLPVRQWTKTTVTACFRLISKLPVRQWTSWNTNTTAHRISKLPVRQWTEIIADYPIDLLLKITKSQVHTLFRDVKIVINKINELHVTLKKWVDWYFFTLIFPS